MTRTWKIKNGDIATDTIGRIEEVSGPGKIVQDLRMWLLNDIGFNTYHPEMGTDLDSYVGQTISSTTLLGIKNSVRQALDNYVDQQMEDLRKRVEERGEPMIAIGLAEPSSIVKEWTKLDVNQIGVDVMINIGFRTFTGDYDEVMLAISSNFYRDQGGL